MAGTFNGIGIAAFSKGNTIVYAVIGTSTSGRAWQAFNVCNAKTGEWITPEPAYVSENRHSNFSALIYDHLAKYGLDKAATGQLLWTGHSKGINATPREVVAAYSYRCVFCKGPITLTNDYAHKRIILKHDNHLQAQTCPLETQAASTNNPVPVNNPVVTPDPAPVIAPEPVNDVPHDNTYDAKGDFEHCEHCQKTDVIANTVLPAFSKQFTSLTSSIETQAKYIESHDGAITELRELYTKYLSSSNPNAALLNKINNLEAAINSHSTLVMPTSHPTDKSASQHYLTPTLRKFLAAKVHTFLPGPAGSGKTTVAMHIAYEMGLSYTVQPCDDTLDRAYILGFVSPITGQYVKGSAYDWYIYGGIYIIDEADRGNASVMVALNALLANDTYMFPGHTTSVLKHQDATAIATGNTYGHGGNEDYAGAQQLDGATLDRFAYLTWNYDEYAEYQWVASVMRRETGNLHLAGYPNTKIATTPDQDLAGVDTFDFNEWVAFVQAFRHACATHKVKAIVSPRASINGALLLTHGVNPTLVIEATCYKGMSQDDRARVNHALRTSIASNPFAASISAE